MKRKTLFLFILLLCVSLFIVLRIHFKHKHLDLSNLTFTDDSISHIDQISAPTTNNQQPSNPNQPAPSVTNAMPFVSYTDNFTNNLTVSEVNKIIKSNSRDWWLGSGAYFYSKDGIGSTIIGALPASDKFRQDYSANNPLDTDNGYYPQNIFRLVLSHQFQNFTQQAYFKIVKDNLSTSSNRNASNGILFFNRYQDEFNLYYTGLRVDGYVEIKKKIGGVYHTMAYKPFLKNAPYNRTTNPDILPKNTWIGLRSVVVDEANGSVDIKLYINIGDTDKWVLSAEAIDNGQKYGGPVFSDGYAGIRTDFMDVEFKNYSISSLN